MVMLDFSSASEDQMVALSCMGVTLSHGHHVMHERSETDVRGTYPEPLANTDCVNGIRMPFAQQQKWRSATLLLFVEKAVVGKLVRSQRF